MIVEIKNIVYRSGYVKLEKNIWVHKDSAKGCKNFVDKIKSDLKTIDSKPVGHRLIKRIKGSDHPIYIHFNASENCAAAHNGPRSRMRDFGCATTVFYNPDKPSSLYDINGKVTKYPTWTSLAHEMIHAYHNQNGKNYTNRQCKVDKAIWSNAEEYHTMMGFPSKNPYRSPKRPKISQYAIHLEHNIVPRFGHIGHHPLDKHGWHAIATCAKAQRIANESAGNPAIPVLLT